MLIIETKVAWSLGDTWCRVAGDPKNDVPPLVIVHGGPAMSSDYLFAHDVLAHGGRAVIYYDQLGGSRSKAMQPVNWSIDVFVRELLAVVSEFNLTSFDLLGHSWGASVAMDFAVTAPSALRKLVLSSPCPSTGLLLEEWRRLVDQLPGVSLAQVEEMERAGDTGSETYQRVCEIFERHYFCRMAHPHELERSMQLFEPSVYEHLWGMEQFRCTGTMSNWDVIDRLGSIAAPTLVISGEYDQATTECVKPITERVRNSGGIVLKGASHMAHLETPEQYMTILRRFLG